MIDEQWSGGSPEPAGEFYTVTEITDALRQHLESEFCDISVYGEIANFKIHTSGHLYFSLRDERNLLRCVIFRRSVGNLAFSPEDGKLVVASGRITHYGGGGQTQLLVYEMTPAGRGALELEFRRLLERLMQEGLTAAERKRALPAYPGRIVVITSTTGAVIRDITNTLGRRWPIAEIVHIGVPVQGVGAARSIIDAFEVANGMQDVDVVILARGGGSAEDLWSFNEEAVARAVAGSAHPVITGIGHEIDTTIVDYVADVRAATPTAAAELAAPQAEDVRRAIAERLRRLQRVYLDAHEDRLHTLQYLLRSSTFPALLHRMELKEMMLGDYSNRLDTWWARTSSVLTSELSACAATLGRSLERSVRSQQVRLAERLEQLSLSSPEKRINQFREIVEKLLRILQMRTESNLTTRNRDLRGIARTLSGLYPLRVLRRGYSYCTTSDGERIISRVTQVSRGEDLMVHFYDGGARCRVEQKRKGKPWRRNRTSRPR